MPTLRLGATVNLWSAETFSGLTAGDYSAVAEFLPGQARGFLVFELVFSAAPTAVSLDIEHAEAGVIYRRLVNFTKAVESFSCAATPGKYRVKVVTVTAAAAETLTLTVKAQTEAPAVADNIEINEASGDSAGAVLRMGLSGFPLRKDTAGTTFIYGNFVNDAVSGTTNGLQITLDAGGTLQTYTNVINAILNATAQLRNPFCFYGDFNWTTLVGVQGSGGVYGAYVAFPTGVLAETGNFGGINLEFAVPAGLTHAASGTPQIAFLRFAVTGDGTAITSLETAGIAQGRLCLMNLQGFTAGGSRCFATGTSTASIAATLRILIGTTEYFIMLSAGAST